VPSLGFGIDASLTLAWQYRLDRRNGPAWARLHRQQIRKQTHVALVPACGASLASLVGAAKELSQALA
jgi:hypothetical protein